MSSIGSVRYHTDNGSDESSSITVEKTVRKKPKWQEHVSDDWLERVKQTQKYNLILNGLQFCRTWTVSDCFRDLIQNATDSMYCVHKKHHGCKKPRIVLDQPPESWDANQKTITKIYLECEKGGRTKPVGYLAWTPKGEKYDGPIISIINLDAKFNANSLCVGISNKGSSDAGGHGEGLKAAITVAIRARNAFEIVQSGVGITFGKSEGLVNYKVVSPVNQKLKFKPLTQELTKKYGVNPQKDVIIHLGNNPNLDFEDFRKAASHFLFLTHRHPQSLEIGNFPVINRKETKSGRAILLGDEFAGKVYVVGIYFKQNSVVQQFYGVDFIKSDALSRDRNEISTHNYQTAMGCLISELLEEDPLFAEVIINEFQMAEKNSELVAHLKAVPGFASAKAKENILAAYKKRPENSDIKYIVSGISADNLTANDIVPMWCDVKACKVVHPTLFSLISAGYPSVEEIKHTTSMNLKACPILDGHQGSLRTWFHDNMQFFPNHDSELFNRIEVRQTHNILDVPLYIVKEGKIIFSERALAIRFDNPRKFLDVAIDAHNEAYVQLLHNPGPIQRQEIKRPPSQLVEHVLSSTSAQEEEFCDTSFLEATSPGWNFPSDFALSDSSKLAEDDETKIKSLEKNLSQRVYVGKHEIRASRAAAQFILENSSSIEALTNRSINACYKALRTLTSDVECKLAFYIDPHSSIIGYASEDDGIHVNLRSVLLDDPVEESALKAYFASLISHEYAHYVKSEDGHSPEHGRRTENNMQKLLQEAYKLNTLE